MLVYLSNQIFFKHLSPHYFMVATIPQIIAATVPDRYYDFGGNKKKLLEFKNLIKEKGIYDSAEKAKAKSDAEHKLVYDSPTETLEPIYFFILDLMNDFGLAPEKLIDNFVSSPGSQHFGEMGQRASIMQQQGAKLLGDVNMVLRSVLNLIYDLREFKTRLQAYEDLKDEGKKEAALLSLKQVWMDKVDMQKGASSIKQMALGQAGFNTLIDGFLIVKNEEDVEKLDLNEIVKRILKPRIHEFNIWAKHSHNELDKRYKIERTYLKSQVNSLKIYSRWARPYMKAAQDLEMGEAGRNPAMVKMFNSMLLELTLLGKHKLDIGEEAKLGNFPEFFSKEKFLKSVNETYHPCVLVDFNFRGIPNKTQQGFVVGGKAEITFRAYALTGSEIEKIDEELKKSDINSALGLIEGTTDESLGNLQEDIDYFLSEEEEDEKEKRPKDTSNPFLALIGGYNPKGAKKEEKKQKPKVSSPNLKWYEKEYFFPTITTSAKETAFGLFEIYKKAHGMASFP